MTPFIRVTASTYKVAAGLPWLFPYPKLFEMELIFCAFHFKTTVFETSFFVR